MKYPMTASIIIVQTDPEHPAVAYVGYTGRDSGRQDIRMEIELDGLDEATDPQMWLQMAAARVCDAV